MVAPDLVSEEDIAKLIISDDLPDEEPTLTSYIEVKVYDEEGHIIQYRRQPMRTPTMWFLALVAIPLIQTYQSSSTNQALSFYVNVFGFPSQQSSYSPSNYCCNGANLVWDFSVLLGSGTQSYSPTLSSLAAPISNGTGAGELSYGSIAVTFSSGSIQVYITVTNYSPTTINVTEIGLMGTIYLQFQNTSNAYQATTNTYLLTYDTFSPAITIPTGAFAQFEIVLAFSG
jgi:hypothetical protein